MRIHSISAHSLNIPFRTGFKHSSAERNWTETLLARTVTTDGLEGFGEGCPRMYVTGEDLPGSLAFIQRIRREIIDSVRSYQDLKDWVGRRQADIDRHPAAWCAVELSVLDALSRELGQSVEATMGFPELNGLFSYTAVLGDATPDVFLSQLQRYTRLGFDDFKVKLRGDAGFDGERLERIREAVPLAGIRLDANNLWSLPADVLRYLERLPFPPFAIEEPLAAGDYAGMRQVAEEARMRIILDESFLRMAHLEQAARLGDKAVVNLRVSKMGGLIRCAEVAERALRAGIPMIVGAHVGETSILTRAALLVANAFKADVLAQEGAFGTYLLERDIVPRPLMFGRLGVLDLAGRLDPERHGFQLSVEIPWDPPST